MTAFVMVAFVAVFAALPWLLLGPVSRRRYAFVDVASYAAAALSWLLLRAIERFTPADAAASHVAAGISELDPRLLFIAFCVGKLALFGVALVRARDARWSAGRAAIAALLIYLMVIPAMMLTVIDGDEPYYTLVAESLLHDHDLDLRNQYATLAHSAVGRTDLGPQLGDPVGSHGEQYSRHELLLPILLIPGLALGGLPGALVTMALFGALLVRSTLRLFEEEGISERTTRLVFLLFAFGPPVLWFAVRIWPEVPAAFCLVEAIRGLRNRRWKRWIPALLALVLFKLRFILIAVALMARVAVAGRSKGTAVLLRRGALLLALIAIPMLIVWKVSGSATNVHHWTELLLPRDLEAMHRGFFGLIADGMSGLAFQAPFYLLGLAALTRWRFMPAGFRLGAWSGVLYLFYLFPRAEWHGGWSPPLRYVTVLMPLLALGAAAMLDRLALSDLRTRTNALVATIALATMALVVHGVTFPWRLFHIENGESPMGEWFSSLYHVDFSRLIPSFVRPNEASVVAMIVVVACFVLLLAGRYIPLARIVPAQLIVPLLALGTIVFVGAAWTPGNVVELEDSHVLHEGGALYPEEYTVARFAYRCGWTFKAGDGATFRMRPGRARIEYQAHDPALLQIGAAAYPLPATGDRYDSVAVVIPDAQRVTVHCATGELTIDRIVHDGR